MAEQKSTKQLILRPCDTEHLELFIGDSSSSELFKLSIKKQLAWLSIISGNLERHAQSSS